MDWVCPFDHAPLRRSRATERPELLCSSCARRFACVLDLPEFPGAESSPEPGDRGSATLQELERAIEHHGADRAAEDFCRRHGCARPHFTTGLSFFLPEGACGRLLEIGGGFGDDTLRLAEVAGELISIVPSFADARVLHRHLGERGRQDVEVAVVRDVTRLPLASGSLTGLVVEEAALAGFGVGPRDFAAAAAEWRRVLAPGGVLLLGLRGSRVGRLALRLVRAAGRPGRRRESLNRRIKTGPGRRSSRLGLARPLRALRRLGFGAPTVHAPLPSEDDLVLVLPLDCEPAVSYGLAQMLRRNSLFGRAAIGLGRLAGRAGFLTRLLPYYFIVMRRAGDGEQP